MGVQQFLANMDNALTGSDVAATAVAPSTEVHAVSMSRSGTGLISLSGAYTGDRSAVYEIQIADGDGNGRSSKPAFSGVGSGDLVVIGADLPVQDISVTLLSPPYPGTRAECLVGSDTVRAKSVGVGGNLIHLMVNRSGLQFSAAGSSSLEAVSAGTTELTGYKWDIPGVVCSTDLKGNVPADAPRIRFGTDPAIYRIVKDARSGSVKTIITPAAVRDIPLGTPIWLVSGSYAVTVTDETSTETYTGITTGYDLLSQLLSSTLVEPAYTPAPVTTPGGNAVTDLPLVTGAQALLSEISSAAIRPPDLTARTTALADMVAVKCKGNGTWSVTASSGAVYPDAVEGVLYAPASSPVIFTIPSRPVSQAGTVPPVMLSGGSFKNSEEKPNVCVVGTLGINTMPKTITATYTKRPNPEDCPCTSIPDPRFNSACLRLNSINSEEDIMGLEPAYQQRLISLYQWQKSFIGSNSSMAAAADIAQFTLYKMSGSVIGAAAGWVKYTDARYPAGVTTSDLTTMLTYLSTFSLVNTRPIYVVDADDTTPLLDQLTALYPLKTVAATEVLIVKNIVSGAAGDTYVLQANDIRLCQSVVDILGSCLSQVWGDADGATAWDSWFADVQTDLSALAGSGALAAAVPQELLARYQSGADLVYATAGIVPGKSDSAGSIASTGCWQNIDAEYWWELSDGYAPAFTNETYYSTRAVTFENSQEFAFMIKCACADRLTEGDTLSIQVGANLALETWGSNESITIVTIPTTPLYLSGGKEPDATEIWAVSGIGNSGGQLPRFYADATNRYYSEDGLSFSLVSGGIPFSVGDAFRFSVEGGTFIWRRDDGDWSQPLAIADGSLLENGVYADFVSGEAPSFVAGDYYSYLVNQVNAASGVLIPDANKWRWLTDGAVITFSLPEPRAVTHLAILHDLPADTAVLVEWSAGSADFTGLAWATGLLRDSLHVVCGTEVYADKIRITVSGAGAIRWIWAGTPLQPYFSAELRLIKQFDMARAKSAGSAVMLASGTAANISWDTIRESDALAVAGMVHYVKSRGDEPVILIPHHLHPEEAVAVRVADDALELVDLLAYQPDDTTQRIYSASMELAPEWK